MATVAVTGGTGYTGRQLIDALIAQGYYVRALARPQRAGVLPLSVETVVGDLSDVEALARLVRGASVVVHIAAVYRTASHSDAYYRAVNVEGARRLAEAAAAARVGRFVHTSTVGVHGDVQRPPADETAPLRPGDVYQRTKLDGERAVLEVSARSGLPCVVLRPAGNLRSRRSAPSQAFPRDRPAAMPSSARVAPTTIRCSSTTSSRASCWRSHGRKP